MLWFTTILVFILEKPEKKLWISCSKRENLLFLQPQKLSKNYKRESAKYIQNRFGEQNDC